MAEIVVVVKMGNGGCFGDRNDNFFMVNILVDSFDCDCDGGVTVDSWSVTMNGTNNGGNRSGNMWRNVCNPLLHVVLMMVMKACG